MERGLRKGGTELEQVGNPKRLFTFSLLLTNALTIDGALFGTEIVKRGMHK